MALGGLPVRKRSLSMANPEYYINPLIVKSQILSNGIGIGVLIYAICFLWFLVLDKGRTETKVLVMILCVPIFLLFLNLYILTLN